MSASQWVVGKDRMNVRALARVKLAGTDGAAHRLGDLFADRRVVLVFARHFG